MSSNVHNILKFRKISRKTYCVRKCEKMGVENFIITLSKQRGKIGPLQLSRHVTYFSQNYGL